MEKIKSEIDRLKARRYELSTNLQIIADDIALNKNINGTLIEKRLNYTLELSVIKEQLQILIACKDGISDGKIKGATDFAEHCKVTSLKQVNLLKKVTEDWVAKCVADEDYFNEAEWDKMNEKLSTLEIEKGIYRTSLLILNILKDA